MARPRQAQPRFDGRGGVNRAFPQDVLDHTEFRRVVNGRLHYGAIHKRAGSQRIHGTVLGAPTSVLGLFQFQPAAGRQVVALVDGDLEHKLGVAANFTNVPSTLSTTQVPRFAVYRSGSSILLFIADGALRKWDGATLTTAIADAPDAVGLAVYKQRMFAFEADSKTLYWSKLFDAETWADPDGGFEDVETFDAEPIRGLAVVGGSLLIFKANNIARFSGVDATDIRIDAETQGVSSEVGLIAPESLCVTEEVAFFLSDRGPYIASEAGVQAIGQKIETDMEAYTLAEKAAAVARHHRARKEIWLHIADDVWIYNYRVQSWSGPWSFPFTITAMAEYEREDETEGLLLAGNDGFIRDGDVASVGAKDDVLSDDSGGSNITLTIEYPELLFGDPRVVKDLDLIQSFEADLKAAGSITAAWSSEMGSGSIAVPSTGAGVRNYRFKWGNAKGRRPKVTLSEATAEIVELNGFTPEVALE